MLNQCTLTGNLGAEASGTDCLERALPETTKNTVGRPKSAIQI